VLEKYVLSPVVFGRGAKIRKQLKMTIFAASEKNISFQKANSAYMSEISKTSMKRSRPSYFMSILGVALVLFILGSFGLDSDQCK
jgi:hypothetical protein